MKYTTIYIYIDLLYTTLAMKRIFALTIGMFISFCEIDAVVVSCNVLYSSTPGRYYGTGQPLWMSGYACYHCPTNSYTVGWKLNINDCICEDSFVREFIPVPWMTADLLQCSTPCNAGSTGPRDNECTECAAGTYKNTPGSAACAPCPRNSTSLVASTDLTACTCNAGTSGINGGPCTKCAAGTYNQQEGSATCTECPSNSISLPESTAVTACVCDAGFSGADGGPCTVICAAGKYKDTTRLESCTPCGSNTYSSAVGATSPNTCIKCPARSSSPIGSDSPGNCKCNDGYAEISIGVCDECEIGKYKSETGSYGCVGCEAGKKMKTGGSGCVDCEAGKYSTTDISDNCEDCPLASSSPGGSSKVEDCTCNKGYSGNNGEVCNQCVSGKYKNNNGDAKCEDCALYSVSNILLTDCTCELGSTRNFSNICVLCAPGKYKDYIGDGDQEECTMCTTGESSTMMGSATKDECEPCAAGKYKDSSNICVDCQQYSSSSTGAEYCDCNAGYIKQNDVCVICNIGTYKFNSANCESCPAGSTSESGSNSKADCECNSGYSSANGALCISCLPGTYKVSLGTASCKNCVSGTYSTKSGATTNTTCLDCPTLTTSPAGSNALINCTCSSGSTINPLVSEFLCVLCSPRRYKSVAGTAVCDQCPKNSISLRGAVNIDDCHCTAGYYNNNDKDLECVACKDGSKKERIGKGMCTKHKRIMRNNYTSCSMCL